MAKPIAPTPDLKGRDADKFLKELENPQARAVSKEDFLRGRRIFEAIRKNSPILDHAV